MNNEEIPHGMYCYKGLKVDNSGDKPKLITKVCPHWEKTEKGAYCSLLKQEHETGDPFHLLWDQVKECGINKSRV